MRFLLDESANARIFPHLRKRGHDVTAIVRDHSVGLPDDEVLAIAYRQGRILITKDRDFGELVFVEHQPHAGVIYLRLEPSGGLKTIVARLDDVLAQHAHQLDRFIVVTRDLIRVR